MRRFITQETVSGYVRDSRGVSALEYAILVGVIPVAIAAALAAFSDSITDSLAKTGTNIKTTTTNTGN